jgi:hypothetical protein
MDATGLIDATHKSPHAKSPDGPSSHVKISYEDLFAPRDSISFRFPGLSGQDVWNIVEEFYIEDDNCTMMLWSLPKSGGLGHRMAVRHSLNQREVDSAAHDYAKDILKCGFMGAMRGKIIYMELPIQVLTSLHLTTSLSS